VSARRFPAWHGAVAATLVLSTALAARAAGPEDAYRDGLTAIEKGHWDEAAAHMRAAIAAKPGEGGKVKLYGMRFEDYLPHYYLGLALFKAGDCAGALEAWKTSESQGAVNKTGKAKDLARDRQECQTRVAQAPPKPPAQVPVVPTPGSRPPTPPPTPAVSDAALQAALRDAQTALGSADDAARTVEQLSRDRSLATVWGSEAELGPAQKRADSQRENARRKLQDAQGSRNPEAAREAAALAGQAREALAAVQRQAEARRAALRAAAQPSATPLPMRPVGPPPRLVEAAGAYFAGDYSRTLRLLASPEQIAAGSSDSRARAHALLLRAAASYSLYLLGGERDAQLLGAARSDLRSVRSLDGGLRPDTRAFSPRFIALFEATR
jgi:hypothetical protein